MRTLSFLSGKITLEQAMRSILCRYERHIPFLGTPRREPSEDDTRLRYSIPNPEEARVTVRSSYIQHAIRHEMARRPQTHLDFIINSCGFIPDFQDDITDPSEKALASRFLEDKFAALYDISFRDSGDWHPPSLLYLHKVGSSFVGALCRTPDLEVLRGSAVPCAEPADLGRIAASVPFIKDPSSSTPNGSPTCGQDCWTCTAGRSMPSTGRSRCTSLARTAT